MSRCVLIYYSLVEKVLRFMSYNNMAQHKSKDCFHSPIFSRKDVPHLFLQFSLHRNTPHFFASILIIIFFIPQVSSCDYYNPIDNSFTCTYCVKSQCTITWQNTTQNISNSMICSQCCNSSSSIFKDRVSHNCDNYSQKQQSSTNMATANILIISFFSVPACICVIIIIMTIVKNRERRQNRRNDQPPLSSVNLADYKLDDIAPAFLDGSGTCSVCLQQKCNIITKCRHAYHSDCLKSWIHNKENCPECRIKQFNPLAIYCVKCFKALKLTYLIDRMSPQLTEEWQKYKTEMCSECLNNNNEVSIDFTLISQKSAKQQKNKNNSLGITYYQTQAALKTGTNL